MKMGWKRKASPDPQLEPAKIPKRASVSTSHFSHKLLTSSWRRKVSTPTKRKSWTSIHALSPGRQAHRFKCQKQKASEGSGETSLMTQVTFISELDVCFLCVCRPCWGWEWWCPILPSFISPSVRGGCRTGSGNHCGWVTELSWF